MKLQYVILLEILRIMVSASQSIDAKITYKSVLEVLKSWKSPYEKSRRIVMKLVSIKSCWFKDSRTSLRSENGQGLEGVKSDSKTRLREFEIWWRGFGSVCVYVYVWLEIWIKRTSEVYMSTQVHMYGGGASWLMTKLPLIHHTYTTGASPMTWPQKKWILIQYTLMRRMRRNLWNDTSTLHM